MRFNIVFISQIAPDCKVIILPKSELDKANKDKKHKHYPTHFQVCSSTQLLLAIMILCLTFLLCMELSSSLSFQVHVVLSQVGTDSMDGCMNDVTLSDYEDDDEEDLSDTDPEDEWESQAV